MNNTEKILVLTYNPINEISIAFMIKKNDFSNLKEDIEKSFKDGNLYGVYIKYAKSKTWCNEIDDSFESFIIENTNGLDEIQISKIIIKG